MFKAGYNSDWQIRLFKSIACGRSEFAAVSFRSALQDRKAES